MNKGHFSDGKLLLQFESGGWYRLRQTPGDLFYYITADGLLIVPPNEMKTDLGSIPRLFWRTFPKDEFAPCYVIHDMLCYYKYAFDARGLDLFAVEKLAERYVFADNELEGVAAVRGGLKVVRVNRGTADDILAECIYTYTGQRRSLKRWLVYTAVRLYGAIAWNKKSERRALEKRKILDAIEG